MQFSVIIPTLNEENFIGILLDSLVVQTKKDFEVIVVDAPSQDKTKEKVLEYNDRLDIKFVVAPRKGVGPQRNYGASLAKYDDLIFFDADISIEKDFLMKIAKYLEENNPDVLTSWVKPLSDRKADKVMFGVYNILLEALKFISPGGGGAFIYAHKKSFLGVGGFSEDIVLGEDFDLFKKMDKEGFKYKLVQSPAINVSVRRLNKEGRVKYVSNIIRAAAHTKLKGTIKDNEKIKYEFGNFE